MGPSPHISSSSIKKSGALASAIRRWAIGSVIMEAEGRFIRLLACFLVPSQVAKDAVAARRGAVARFLDYDGGIFGQALSDAEGRIGRGRQLVAEPIVREGAADHVKKLVAIDSQV